MNESSLLMLVAILMFIDVCGKRFILRVAFGLGRRSLCSLSCYSHS